MLKKCISVLVLCLFATVGLFAQCSITPSIAVSGASPTCQHTTYSFTTQTGMTNYVWAVSAGTIISGQGTNAVSVQWSGTGSQNISVFYTTGGGCTINPTVLPVTIGARTTAIINTAPPPVCTGYQVTYTTQAGMNNYLWTVPTFPQALTYATVISGQGTNSITLVWESPLTSGAAMISVTYVDPAVGGCGAYGVRGVLTTQSPNPNIGGSPGVCLVSGNSTQFTTETGMSGYSWNVSPDGTITSGQGSAYVFINWTTPGSKTVSVNYTSNSCAAPTPATKSVNVTTPPSALTISGATTACTNATVNYTTSPGMPGYNWFVTNGAVVSGAGTNAISVLWRNGGPSTVNVFGIDANGCYTPSNPLSVTVNGPTITGSPSACSGGAGATYSINTGGTGYNWTVIGSANGTIASGQGTNSIQVVWGNAGGGVVTATYNGTVNGCSATNPTGMSVTVFTTPVPSISGLTAVCQGTPVSFYTTEFGLSNYVWTAPGGAVTVFSPHTAMVRWDLAGPQPLSVSYKDLNQCSGSKTITVNVATRTLNGTPSVCAGTTGVVYTTEAGHSTYTWTISAGGTITSGLGTNTVNVTWNTVGAQTISVRYQTGTSCNPTTPVTKNVTVNARPVPTITGVALACAGTTGVSYTTEAGKTGYTWTVPSGGTITSGTGTNSINVSWTTAGARSVTVGYTDANGCTPTTPFSKSVTVNARPVPVITGAAAVCVNSPSAYNTETGKTGYTWAIVGGTINSGQGTASANVTWNTTGAQSLTVTYTDANGCTPVTPTSKPVTVNARPVPTITGLTPVCASTTGVTYTTETGKTGYTWTISPGGTITAGAATNVATVTWNTAGAQTISVNYTDANGCVATIPTSKAVTVNARPSPTITGSASQCVNTSTGYSTETGKTGYVWTANGGTINSGQSTASINVTWTTIGARSVSVTYADANACSPLVPFTKNVTVNPRPVPVITGVSSSCQGTTGVTYTTETGKTGYTWTISAGGTITAGSTTNTATVTWNTTGAQTISVNYTDANGCVATTATSKAVTVNSRPSPTVTGVATICPNVAASYTTEPGKSGYFWAASGGGSITGQGTNQASVTWSTAGAQTVSVTYVDANGCSPANPVVKNVTVNGTVTPTIAKVGAACTLRTNQFTTATGMTNYSWTVPSGGTIEGSATGSTITVLFDYITTTRTVSVSYTDPNGCASAVGSLNVFVNQSFPNGGVQANGAQICGTEGALWANFAGSATPGTFVWTIPAELTAVRQGSVATGDASMFYVKWSDMDPHLVSVHYTTPEGCVSTGSNNVAANNKGPQQITGVDFTQSVVKYWGDPSFTQSPVSTSGQPVTWSLQSGAASDVVSRSGNTFTVLNAGITGYNASVPADACYNSATELLSVHVNKLQTHTLTYTPLPVVNCDFAVVQVISSSNQTVIPESGSSAVSLGNNAFKVFSSGYSFRSINNRNVVDAFLNNVPATIYWTPSAGVTTGSDIPFCANEAGRSATVSANNLVNINVWGQPGVVFQWMRDGVDIPGANNTGYVATTAGDYQLRLSRDICQTTTSELTVTTIDCTNFTVSPNPADNSFTITVPFTPHNTANFKVFNSMGQQKYNQNMSINNATLNVNSNNYTAGVYSVVGTFGTTIITKNIVITH